MRGLAERLRAERAKLRHYVLYLIFGGLTTALNFGLYTLLTRALGWGGTTANAVSVVCAVLFAYVTNKLVVFQSSVSGAGGLAREFASFAAGRAFTMVLEIGGFELLHTWLKFHDLAVKAALTVVIIILNYLISRFVVFRTPGKRAV